MRNVFLAALMAATAIGANTESKWTVSQGAKTLGTMTLLKSASGSRAEWHAAGGKSATTVFLKNGDKIWLRTTGGDVELSTINSSSVENDVAPFLLIVDPANYKKIDAKQYTLTRTSLTSSNADASNFAVRPKKGASSRLARLSGDLLGPSDTSVAATAGGRGVGTKGLKLNDGGDYGAVEKLENRDAAWKEKMSTALEEFQKDGKIGKGREDQ